MIYYDSAGIGLRTLLKWRGSVAGKALAFAIPCGILGGCFCALRVHVLGEQEDYGEAEQVGTFIAFNSILGFLLIFRTQIAYSRYWEGTTLMQKVRGQWFNSISHLFSFFVTDPDKHKEVMNTKFVLIKLMSLLYCTALRSVAMTGNNDFELIDLDGLEPQQLIYAATSHDPPAVLMHWIQRAVVKSIRDELIDMPAPIVSRVFHELSNGIVELADATKISDTPFPFAFAQMISIMLVVQFIFAPIVCASLTHNIAMAVVGSFLAIFLSCSMNLIASEIELPFGDDANDLPLYEMQKSMNVSLLTLVHWRTQSTPKLQKLGLSMQLSGWNQCMLNASAGGGDDGMVSSGLRSSNRDASDQTNISSAMIRSLSIKQVKTFDPQLELPGSEKGTSSGPTTVPTPPGNRKYEHLLHRWRVKAGVFDHPITQFIDDGSLLYGSANLRQSHGCFDTCTQQSSKGLDRLSYCSDASAGRSPPASCANCKSPSPSCDSKGRNPLCFYRQIVSEIGQGHSEAGMGDEPPGPPATPQLDLCARVTRTL